MSESYDRQAVEELLKSLNTYITNPDHIVMIERALMYAREKHQGQIRKSGEPYINHLIQVALILSSLRVGPKTIAAG